VAYFLDERDCRDLERSTSLEWMLPNGIGGYAMGTVSGINTRRYHGHLIAATKPPAERSLLLATVEATMQAEGQPVPLSSNQYPGATHPDGYRNIESFRASADTAEWHYRSGSLRVRKTLRMHAGANACTLEYENCGERPLLLVLRPLVAHRSHHGNFGERPGYPAELEFPKNLSVIGHDGLRLVLCHPGAQRLPVQGWYYRFEHTREFERGLDGREDLYCPCELRYEVLPGEVAALTASEGGAVEPLPTGELETAEPQSLQDELSEACRKFLVQGQRSSIIAGYPWFADWGRDTMIALPGICIRNGKHAEARQILSDYAVQMRQGLIPNRFAEDGQEPEYNTADATLWYANAVYEALRADWQPEFAEAMFRSLLETYDWHVLGTHFGIRMDPEDGLLTQGAPGVQLTWMDVKIDEWVVTPRHGKPIEICALWINMLRILEWLATRLGQDAPAMRAAAETAEASFERKFWCESRGHYFDTVDPYDASLRPNQVLAMSLPFGPAKGEKAEIALKAVEDHLATPVGLRTLGPGEPGYRGRFTGPLRELDMAYHQGTVWPWLLGPYCSALVRVRGDREGARKILEGAKAMLEEYGLGGISECYDGDAPHRPGGCPWQAWSVAELHRALAETMEESA
jgi:predicted glycogen debranching enzyme